MKLISYIYKYQLVILSVLGIASANAQNLNNVCVGSTETYAVSGLKGSVFIWEVDDPSSTIDTNGDSAVIHWNSPGIHKITVKEITGHGCEGAPVYAFVNVEHANIGFDETIALCEGEEKVLDAGDFDFYQWNNGSTSRTQVVNEEGKVWVHVSTTSGCYGSDTAIVTIHDAPLLDLGNDTVLCGDERLELDAGHFDAYEWSTGDNSRYLDVYAMQQTIGLTVTNEHGCTATDSLHVLECDVASMFSDIPNAITPNGDGVHDVWEIPNIEMYPEAKIEIFDRWGRLVFKKDGNYHNDWDGTDLNGKKLPMDSYHYVIDFRRTGSNKVVGNITIIR